MNINIIGGGVLPLGGTGSMRRREGMLLDEIHVEEGSRHRWVEVQAEVI